MNKPRQNPLGLSVRGDDDLDIFIAGRGVVDGVVSALLGRDGAFSCVFIYGPEASGKTHLLNGLSRRAVERGLPLLQLDPRTMSVNDMPRPESIEPGALIVCDDADSPVNQQAREDMLWTLYLEMEARAMRLLLSASQHPRQTFSRPELGSRFAGQHLVALKRLDGADLRAMLFDKIHKRGLDVAEPVLDYLLNNTSRDAGRLARLIADIDASCQARRSSNVTIPIIKSALEESGS